MLGVSFLLASLLAMTTAFQFTDCATDKSNTAVKVNHLYISKDVIEVPGQIQISTHITINQQLTHLFVDTVFEKETLGVWTRIPCARIFEPIGSCQNIDFCTRLDNARNISSVISENLDKQIDAILLKALGRQYCPISPENLIICHETLTFQALPATLSLILQGTYRITISVKDDPTNPDNLGCIQFQIEVRRRIDPNQVG